ncbi:DUF5676 family membrane protein [Rhodoligotrophos defluvii]|uniref:DUF5676 family membrane protein n=1 Tax=Rhodoligotrophos defluvii TaxID=2561934 RepID=UPI0010C9F26E|nr:DUF5676 family membrane protein [Rhodoligotrophos defluvii]
MLNTRLVTWALSLWTAITFVVCVVYGLVTPQSLGMQQFLEMVLPAFKWLTWWGFLLGLAESFLYGAYAGLVFCPVYNLLQRRWGAQTGQKA